MLIHQPTTQAPTRFLATRQGEVIAELRRTSDLRETAWVYGGFMVNINLLPPGQQ